MQSGWALWGGDALSSCHPVQLLCGCGPRCSASRDISNRALVGFLPAERSAAYFPAGLALLILVKWSSVVPHLLCTLLTAAHFPAGEQGSSSNWFNSIPWIFILERALSGQCGSLRDDKFRPDIQGCFFVALSYAPCCLWLRLYSHSILAWLPKVARFYTVIFVSLHAPMGACMLWGCAHVISCVGRGRPGGDMVPKFSTDYFFNPHLRPRDRPWSPASADPCGEAPQPSPCPLCKSCCAVFSTQALAVIWEVLGCPESGSACSALAKAVTQSRMKAAPVSPIHCLLCIFCWQTHKAEVKVAVSAFTVVWIEGTWRPGLGVPAVPSRVQMAAAALLGPRQQCLRARQMAAVAMASAVAAAAFSCLLCWNGPVPIPACLPGTQRPVLSSCSPNQQCLGEALLAAELLSTTGHCSSVWVVAMQVCSPWLCLPAQVAAAGLSWLAADPEVLQSLRAVRFGSIQPSPPPCLSSFFFLFPSLGSIPTPADTPPASALARLHWCWESPACVLEKAGQPWPPHLSAVHKPYPCNKSIYIST